MHTNAYRSYLENEVLTAEPLKLIQLLYEGALEAVESAERHLREGDIHARSQAITKALRIMHALTSALDHHQGGELSARLARLYDYIERLLIEANAKQEEAPLIEAHRLLNTVLEGWRGCAAERDAAREHPHSDTQYQALSCAF